ncbi:twin-arginine translocation signal domain-containing protein [Amycolatopsis antarctica]|uniref:twin-arginine translocation signal domain-containing protein n=1 Tax=Amycolatopsis antarctica TaxID=1854586 RepID=UPI001F0B0ECC|nr:twin-arginine translocation signal domain-containing protein [Amycolatopsis antarctica]
MSRLERSQRPVADLDKMEEWARTLKIPDQLLWFTMSPQTSDTYFAERARLTASGEPEGDDVQRRKFLKTATASAVTVGAGLLNAPPSAVRLAAGTDTSDAPPVEIVRQVTQTFRRLDNRYGGGHSRSPLVAYLKSSVEPTLKEPHRLGKTRDAYYTAAAEMHQLVGWMAYDTGQADAGRRHLRQALRLCQEAGDDALVGEMLAGMSHHAAFHGSPDAAEDLAIAAKQAGRRSGLSALEAESSAMEAHALALQDDSGGCLRALAEAEKSFGAAKSDNSPEWLGYFDQAYLSAKFAHTFRDLGRAHDAEQFARRSLEMSDGYERGRLFNTALLASILADQRRIDESCALGVSAVNMTETVRSIRSASYLADLGDRLAPFRDDPQVRGLYEHMTDAGLPTPTRSTRWPVSAAGTRAREVVPPATPHR